MRDRSITLDPTWSTCLEVGIIALNDFVPNPFAGVITSGELSGPDVRAYQLQLPFPHFTNFNADDRPVANSIYHALQFRAEKRFSNGSSSWDDPGPVYLRLLRS